LNILVLAGGLSPEREVSLCSGSLIAEALAKNGHSVYLHDLYDDILSEDYTRLFSIDNHYEHKLSGKQPDLKTLIASHGGRENPVGDGVLDLCRAADVTFLALHGGVGEDGRVQAMLELAGVKYTGSSSLGSMLAMNKEVAKNLMRGAGIATPDWVLYKGGKPSAREIADKIGFPCVVKPNGCGSSVGVSMANNLQELESALAASSEYENEVVIEKKISGREFSAGVLSGKALPPIEIIPKCGFYDYNNKYESGKTEEVCPADLTPEQTETIKSAALAVFHVLRLNSYARTDFMLGSDGIFYCLEANTLPGMTPVSLLPQEAAAVGIGFRELCERIVENAI
jgi:D-alanine-D-alanine ligase